MTTDFVRTVRRASMVAIFALLPSVAAAQDALLRLDHLADLAGQARETVDLTIPPEVLQLATAFISPDDPNQAEIKELIANLKGVYVKSFRFDREGAYNQGFVPAEFNVFVPSPGTYSGHLASGTKRESCTLSFTGISRGPLPGSNRAASTSASRRRSGAVGSSAPKRAALKLVGKPTWRTFFGWSGGRKAWGSGLASVVRPGSNPSQTRGSA